MKEPNNKTGGKEGEYQLDSPYENPMQGVLALVIAIQISAKIFVLFNWLFAEYLFGCLRTIWYRDRFRVSRWSSQRNQAPAVCRCLLDNRTSL